MHYLKDSQWVAFNSVGDRVRVGLNQIVEIERGRPLTYTDAGWCVDRWDFVGSWRCSNGCCKILGNSPEGD